MTSPHLWKGRSNQGSAMRTTLARLLDAPPTPAEWAVLVPFGVFCFVYPFAIILLSLDLMPFGMEWMSSLLLAMLGLAAAAWLWLNFGVRGASAAVLLFFLGLALEYVGVTTGFPFGSYRYTGVLVPGLPSGVPLAIGFAWLAVVVAGFFTARRLVWSAERGVRNAKWLVTSLAGALLVLGLDLLLEPVAYHVKRYWEWLGSPGGYYGVPWSNFAAWFAAGLIMCLLLGAFLRPRALRCTWVPPALYTMNVVLFAVVNVAHGFWLAGLVGVGLLGLVWLYRPRTADDRP